MRWLAAQYTRTPFYGVRRMTVGLRQQGSPGHAPRVARLLQTMGVETRYPTPRLSQPHPEHRVSPYSLRGVPMTRVKQVWSTDLPSIRLHAGFVYLGAGLDWFSRSGLSWAVSITMEVRFCLEALAQALGLATPDIFHRDQGAQCTRADCTGR
jgi:putative transposase